jgi:hypothetical protein
LVTGEALRNQGFSFYRRKKISKKFVISIRVDETLDIE